MLGNFRRWILDSFRWHYRLYFSQTIDTDNRRKIKSIKKFRPMLGSGPVVDCFVTTLRNNRKSKNGDSTATRANGKASEALDKRCVLKQSGGARRSVTEEKVKEIRAGLQRSQSKSIRQASRQFNVQLCIEFCISGWIYLGFSEIPLEFLSPFLLSRNAELHQIVLRTLPVVSNLLNQSLIDFASGATPPYTRL
ncbi:hypothetical protein ANN_26313 [Periplaneta americana]|uniref:Uncharacterized protein n=1 Tax=Periplaneta americana TaxID=6978 RepID=A0ABQ8S5J6_PERAM|nr:hypothetical protein ANN_26313 [Periplaneta americana]